MKQKYKYEFPNGIAGTLVIDLSVAKKDLDGLREKGITEEEIDNLIAQEFTLIRELLGVSGDAGG